MEMSERERAIAVLQKERKTALHDNVWAFDYAISSLKTDLKYDLMYEGEDIYTKDDIVAMLEEISLEIDEMDYASIIDCQKLIREKINTLGGKTDVSKEK